MNGRKKTWAQVLTAEIQHLAEQSRASGTPTPRPVGGAEAEPGLGYMPHPAQLQQPGLGG